MTCPFRRFNARSLVAGPRFALHVRQGGGRIDLKQQGGSSVGSTMLLAGKPLQPGVKEVLAAVHAVKALSAMVYQPRCE